MLGADGSTGSKFDAASRLRMASEHPESRATMQVKAFVSVDADFDEELPGCDILQRLGHILLVSADIESLTAVAELPGVRHISIEKSLRADNELSARAVGADIVAAGTGDTPPFTGKNVLVGLFDTGFDLHNPSFVDSEGNSRIEFLYHYPEADCEAIVYDSDGLSALNTENSDDCHGTHVLGTIAGRYDGMIERATGVESRETVAGSTYAGMATEAAIAIAAGSLTDANIIDGVSRIFEHAKECGRPCVVNLSISEITGPHDGSDLFAASLAELAKEGIIVMSSGNYASHMRSITKNFSEDDTNVGTFLWPVWWSLDHSGILAVWSADKEPLEMCLKFGNMSKEIVGELPVAADTELMVLVTKDYKGGNGRPKGVVSDVLDAGYTDSYIAILTDRSPSGRHCYYIAYELHRRAGAGIAPGIMVSGKAGQRADIYLESDHGELQSFYIPGYRAGGDDMSVSSMAAADGTICVGAWTGLPEWHTLDGRLRKIDETGYSTGTIARFSSFGTQLNGKQLPATAAPGAAVLSVYSTPYHDAHPDDSFYGIHAQSVDSEKPVYFTAMYGTSMSSPVVAGSIAQWLEADAELSGDDIMDIIARTSTVDDAVLECPERWGAGKFNALAGLSAVLERKASVNPPTIGDNTLTVLRRGTELEIFLDGERDFTAALYTPSGLCAAKKLSYGGKATIDTQMLPKGIYIINAGGKSKKIIL